LPALLAIGAIAAPAPVGRHYVYQGSYVVQGITPGGQKMQVKADIVTTGGSKAILYQAFTPAAKAGSEANTVYQLTEIKPAGNSADGMVGMLSPNFAPRISRALKQGARWTEKSGMAPALPAGTPLTARVVGQEKIGSKLCWIVSAKPTAKLPLKQGAISLNVCEQKIWAEKSSGDVYRITLTIGASRRQGAKKQTLQNTVRLDLKSVGNYPAGVAKARQREFSAFQALDQKMRSAFQSRPSEKTINSLISAAKAHQKKFARGAYLGAANLMVSSLQEVKKFAAAAAARPSLAGLVGKPAPKFAVKTLAGKSVKLESYRGKVVLLNFFASW